MADNVNIFEKYGIKEVANVYFEALDTDLKAGVYKGDIVLFLDTLKVSTIETTAENVAAQGGWGNPRLVQWDYGKEINVTLTDALISLESLRFMLGGAIKKKVSAQEPIVVHHTEEVVCTSGGVVPFPVDHITGKKFDGTEAPVVQAVYGHPVRLINLTKGTRTQIVVETAGGAAKALPGNKSIVFNNPSLIDSTSGGSEMVGEHQQATVEGDRIRIFWDVVLNGTETKETAVEVTISPNTFPGTYKIVGDTFMRSQETGADEPFQFIINKAKVQSNVTITLEAEGDPSTFDMTLNVLRDTSGEEMMKLVRYKISEDTSASEGNDWGSISA